MSGYHVSSISKGVVGEFSKIAEEVAELEDAILQGNKCMALMECSDIVGAIDAYLQKQYNGCVSLEDLIVMTRLTQKVFIEGYRK